MKWFISLLILISLSLTGWADTQSEMLDLTDRVFSGNGQLEQVEWSNFTFQVFQDSDPVDIGQMYQTTSLTPDQRDQAALLFLKSQGLAQAIERQGKTITDFFQSKGFTMAIKDHEFTPALILFKDRESTRRFEFIRQDGHLKLARVILLRPSQNS